MNNSTFVQVRRRRKLVLHSSELEESEEDNFDDVRAELKATSFNLVLSLTVIDCSLIEITHLMMFCIFELYYTVDCRADKPKGNIR